MHKIQTQQMKYIKRMIHKKVLEIWKLTQVSKINTAIHDYYTNYLDANYDIMIILGISLEIQLREIGHIHTSPYMINGVHQH